MLKVSDFSPFQHRSPLFTKPPVPGILMRSASKKKKGGKTNFQSEVKEKEREDKEIRCFRCSHTITLESQKTEISGKHAHFFTNPAGTGFDLRCFSDAPGCETKGVPLPEFTWFPGYNWCFAFCSECSVQSGWFYLSPNDSFFGLIREAFISE